MRKAENQTFVSSRTTGFTALGFHLRTRRGDVSFNVCRSVALGPPMDAMEQSLEILAPLFFGINRKETDFPFTHPHSIERFQHSVFVYGPDYPLHVHLRSTFRSSHQASRTWASSNVSRTVWSPGSAGTVTT